MLQLIDHIVRTSARRDRTEINSALVDAVADLFHPQSLAIYRCFTGESQTMVFNCAGINSEGRFLRNAYLPERQYCKPIDKDPLLRQAQREASVVLDILPDGEHRLVFPIIRMERLFYLIDIVVPESISADYRVLLMGLIEYFGNHIALLDYGETDTLTGLPNRKTFDKHLFEVLGKPTIDDYLKPSSGGIPGRRKGSRNSQHWLAVCDLDHFKLINDRHGHLIGDEVLVMFARLMLDSFRYDDQLFRFGGEEFVIVLQPAERDNVHGTFERFRQQVENHTFSRVGKVTVSIGYSQLVINDTPPDVIDRADEALYFAKRSGRNQIAGYESLIDSGQLSASSHHKGEIELF